MGRDQQTREDHHLPFEGIMKQDLYVDILEISLLPFIREVFPDGRKLMQVNDSKHASNYVRAWMERNGLNWWNSPFESPRP